MDARMEMGVCVDGDGNRRRVKEVMLQRKRLAKHKPWVTPNGNEPHQAPPSNSVFDHTRHGCYEETLLVWV